MSEYEIIILEILLLFFIFSIPIFTICYAICRTIKFKKENKE